MSAPYPRLSHLTPQSCCTCSHSASIVALSSVVQAMGCLHHPVLPCFCSKALMSGDKHVVSVSKTTATRAARMLLAHLLLQSRLQAYSQ